MAYRNCIWYGSRVLFISCFKRKDFRVTINACHPGAVATNFGQDADKGFLMNSIFKMALYFMAKPEQGAGTSIYLASSPDVEGLSGNFYDAKAKLEKPDDRYYSEENAKIVWDFARGVRRAFL